MINNVGIMKEKTYHGREWLYDHYVDKKESLKEMATLCSVTPVAVLNWMKKHNIPRRSPGESVRLNSLNTITEFPYHSRSWLQEMYTEKEMSAPQIARTCGVTHRTVLYWLEQHGIETRSRGDGVHLVNGHHLESFPIELRQFLDGSLLGDGCLTMSHAPSAWYRQKSKFKGYAAWVKAQFQKWGVETTPPRHVTNTGAGVRNRLFSSTYAISSKSYADFKAEHKRWYPEGKKAVPKDLQLSPSLVCKWMMDDGCRYPTRIALCTNCFSKDDVIFLQGKLLTVGIPSVLSESKKGSDQWIIYINKPGYNKFFDYIGRSSPVPEMAYKFPNLRR